MLRTLFLPRIFLGVFLTSLMLFSGNAQPQRGQRQGDGQPGDKREAIEARRISYITRQLSLTTTEARDFWPIYNEYSAKVEQIAEKFRAIREQLPEPKAMNEEQALQFIEAELQRFEESAALRREYSEKMLEAISIQQLALLFEAERGFNRMLFREAQRRHRQDEPGRRN